MNPTEQSLYQHDIEQTLGHRSHLFGNKNLMFWYQKLYQALFLSVTDIDGKRILEIGSGSSPLKHFLPQVVTSDVLKLDHLDVVFDCHDIAGFTDIEDHSIDIITMTNVLHHLRDPIRFLRGATKKLAKGGHVYMVEPYFSFLSYPVYKTLHHEPVNFNISRPCLDRVCGPLSSSNQAIPYMIFFSRPEWLRELADYYVLGETKYEYFTSLAYMMTGGFSRTIPIPHWIYRSYFPFDQVLSRFIPRLFASFFIVRLVAER